MKILTKVLEKEIDVDDETGRFYLPEDHAFTVAELRKIAATISKAMYNDQAERLVNPVA